MVKAREGSASASGLSFVSKVVLALLLALPMPAAALTQQEARHLAFRTGDAAIPGVMNSFIPLTRQQAVDRVLAGLRTEPLIGKPSWADELPRDTSKMTAAERTAYDQRRAAQRNELPTWWYMEMVATPSPLTERLVLFWHDHFTSSIDKVGSAQMMYRQNQLFRSLGTRDFGALLAAIVRDPAMLIYLDNNRNIARAPNENLARELMELFTLGIGNYTEQDVKELARALTGYTVDRTTEAFVFNRANHDAGEKIILGSKGSFNGDTAAQLLLNHPKTAERIVTKLWLEFVSPQPDATAIQALVKVFRDNKFQMRPLLRALFLSDAFWDPANRASLVRHPAEYVVHTARALGLPPRETANLHGQAVRMGQTLFAPPNVAGWPGHLAWINTTTLPARQTFATNAVTIWRNEVAPVLFKATSSTLPRMGQNDLDLLNVGHLAVGPTYTQPAAPLEISAALRAVVLDAGYQTK